MVHRRVSTELIGVGFFLCASLCVLLGRASFFCECINVSVRCLGNLRFCTRTEPGCHARQCSRQYAHCEGFLRCLSHLNLTRLRVYDRITLCVTDGAHSAACQVVQDACEKTGRIGSCSSLYLLRSSVRV